MDSIVRNRTNFPFNKGRLCGIFNAFLRRDVHILVKFIAVVLIQAFLLGDYPGQIFSRTDERHLRTHRDMLAPRLEINSQAMEKVFGHLARPQKSLMQDDSALKEVHRQAIQGKKGIKLPEQTKKILLRIGINCMFILSAITGIITFLIHKYNLDLPVILEAVNNSRGIAGIAGAMAITGILLDNLRIWDDRRGFAGNIPIEAMCWLFMGLNLLQKCGMAPGTGMSEIVHFPAVFFAGMKITGAGKGSFPNSVERVHAAGKPSMRYRKQKIIFPGQNKENKKKEGEFSAKNVPADELNKGKFPAQKEEKIRGEGKGNFDPFLRGAILQKRLLLESREKQISQSI